MSTTEHDDLDQYRAEMKSWLAENLTLADTDAALRTEHESSPEDLQAERDRQAQVYDAGYIGITLPREYGGQGLSNAHQRIWNEESFPYSVPAPGGIASSVTLGIITPTILAHGSEDQKRDWVPKMLRGDEIWAQLLSEPGAGSDLAGLLTRATRDGDVWVISGTKVWSSGAMSADYGVCLARTDWDAPKHRGLTWFKVPLHDDRVTVRPVREINGGAEFCEEFLDDVVVADDMVIGEVNGGWPIANTMLAVERGAAAGTGGHRSGGESGAIRRPLAPDLVRLAEQRGLAGDAAARQIIARAHINDYMQGLVTARLGGAMMRGDSPPAAASYIKLGLGIIQPLRASAALELAGRSGIAWPAGDSRGSAPAVNYLNGRIMSIAGGSNQIQRNIIAERMLGLPREPSADTDKSFREVLRDAKSWGTKS